MRSWYKFNRYRFTRYLQKLYLQSYIIKQNLSIQELYMLTINSYHTAVHVENKIILFIILHLNMFKLMEVSLLRISGPHWSTSIIKGLFPLIVIPNWEDKGITRLASSTFGMNWRCENKLWWEVRWRIVMETFKNNNKKLFIPSFMQFTTSTQQLSAHYFKTNIFST